MKTRCLLLGLAACATAASAAEEIPLRYDPFVTPPPIREPAAPRPGPAATAGGLAPAGPVSTPEPPWQPHLRATLVSGAGSVADVDGVVLRVGEAVDGHRLVEVRERAAVFEKGGARVLVSMDAAPIPLPRGRPGDGRGPG
jgi:hypothetical protein